MHDGVFAKHQVDLVSERECHHFGPSDFQGAVATREADVWLCRAGPWVLAFANAYTMIFKTKKNLRAHGQF